MNKQLKASVQDFIETLIQFEKDKKVWRHAHKETHFIPVFNATSQLSDEVDTIDEKIFTNRDGEVKQFLQTLKSYGPVPDYVLESAELVSKQLRLSPSKDKPLSWIVEIVLNEDTPQIRRDIEQIAKECPSIVKLLEDGYNDEFACTSKADLLHFAELIKNKLGDQADAHLLSEHDVIGLLFVQQKLGASLTNFEYYNQFKELEDNEELDEEYEQKRIYDRRILDTVELENKQKTEDEDWHQKYIEAVHKVKREAEEKQHDEERVHTWIKNLVPKPNFGF